MFDSNASCKRTNSYIIITPKEDFHAYIFVDLKLVIIFILKVMPKEHVPMLVEIKIQSIDEDSENA